MLQPPVLIQPTPQERARLIEVWEWHEITGDPIPVPPPSVGAPPGTRGWRRHVPAVRKGGRFIDSPADLQFVQQMQNNDVASFDVNLNLNIRANATQNQHDDDVKMAKHGFLGMMVHADFKKISVANRRGGFVRVTKNNNPLTVWDPWTGEGPVPLPHLQPEGTVAEFPLQSFIGSQSIRRPVTELASEVNLNGSHGWMGPGSFWCRDPHCIVTGSCMTSSSEVRWGPRQDQIFYPIRRFKCNANNLVYMCHCDACLNLNVNQNIIQQQLEVWTNYIGSTYLDVMVLYTTLICILVRVLRIIIIFLQ